MRSSEFDRMLSGGKGGSKLIEPDLGSGSKLIDRKPARFMGKAIERRSQDEMFIHVHTRKAK